MYTWAQLFLQLSVLERSLRRWCTSWTCFLLCNMTLRNCQLKQHSVVALQSVNSLMWVVRKMNWGAAFDWALKCTVTNMVPRCMWIYVCMFVKAALMEIWPSHKMMCPSAIVTAGWWWKSSSRTTARQGLGYLEKLWVGFLFFSVPFLICLYFVGPCPSCPAPCPHFVRTFPLPPIFSLELGCVMPHLVAVGCFAVHCGGFAGQGEALLHWWGSATGSLFHIQSMSCSGGAWEFQILSSFAAACLFLSLHLFSFPWMHGCVSAACQVCPARCRNLSGTQVALLMVWHFQPVLPEQGWMWCSGPQWSIKSSELCASAFEI